MSAESHRDIMKVILFNGKGASSALVSPVTPESAYRHYQPLLEPLAHLRFIPVFTAEEDTSLEMMNRFDGSSWLVKPVTDTEDLLQCTDDKAVLALYRMQADSGFSDVFEQYLVPGEGKLLIVTGFSFRDRRINDSIAKGIEGGLRLLVIDDVIQYKQLAEWLYVSDIKHKARIEKMEFGSWNDAKIHLLSGIIKDELRRLETAE